MPVLYASRSLKGDKRQYSVMDFEALAFWAFKTFKVHYGSNLKIVTDHNLLIALAKKLLKENNLLVGRIFYKFKTKKS